MTPPPPDPTTLALIAAEDHAHNALLGSVEGVVRHTLNGFHDWYDHDAITTWAKGLSKLILPFQHSAAQTTDGYMSSTIGAMTGKRVAPSGTRKTVLSRVGVTPEGVVGRVADTYRVQQAQIDKAFQAAIRAKDASLVTNLVTPTEAATNKAIQLAGSQMQVARRNQAAVVMADAERRGLITGYRRVIHPELSKGGTCGLCIAATTRIYYVKELMPMHDGCHCLPVPVANGMDPGAAINDADLREYYAAAGGTSAAALKRTRYRVDEHGELGPVLAPEDAPIQPAPRVRKTPQPRTPAERKAAIERRREQMSKVYNDLADKMSTSPEDWTPEQWSTVAAGMKSRLHDLAEAA